MMTVLIIAVIAAVYLGVAYVAASIMAGLTHDGDKKPGLKRSLFFTALLWPVHLIRIFVGK